MDMVVAPALLSFIINYKRAGLFFFLKKVKLYKITIMLFGCIIIDFDYTLFDAAEFKVAMALAFQRAGAGKQIFWESYAKLRGQGTEYSPEKHIASLRDLSESDKALLNWRLRELIANSGLYLYPDAPEFLKTISALDIPLILLSRGDRNFQQNKISACGIKNYFTEITVVQKTKKGAIKEIAKKFGNNLIFINDNPKEIREAITICAEIKPILKRRKDISANDYAKETVPNFKTLKEIKEYIWSSYGK